MLIELQGLRKRYNLGQPNEAEVLHGIDLRVRPRSFFQTNTAVTEQLYRQVAQWVDAVGPASVWDLYCGVGGFALHVAGPGREVVGTEISEEAVVHAQSLRIGVFYVKDGKRVLYDDENVCMSLETEKKE